MKPKLNLLLNATFIALVASNILAADPIRCGQRLVDNIDLSECRQTPINIQINSNARNAILRNSVIVANSNLHGLFENTDFHKATIGRGSELVGYNFFMSPKGNFDKANFSNATMDGDILKGYMVNINFQDAILTRVEAVGVNFANSNLSGANLEASNLTRAHGENVAFKGASLLGTALNDVNFVNPNFSEAVINGAQFPRARFRNANFTKLKSAQGANFTGAHFTYGAGFSSSNLSDAIFEGAILDQPSFSGGTLNNVNFSRARLREAKFQDASAQGANFTGAPFM